MLYYNENNYKDALKYCFENSLNTKFYETLLKWKNYTE